MEHSSSRAICSKVSQRTSRHWNERALFLFGSALMGGRSPSCRRERVDFPGHGSRLDHFLSLICGVTQNFTNSPTVVTSFVSVPPPALGTPHCHFPSGSSVFGSAVLSSSYGRSTGTSVPFPFP